jgi:DNA-binding CsgD family transcriptional regulator
METVLDTVDAIMAAPDHAAVHWLILPVLEQFGLAWYGADRIFGPGRQLDGTPLFPGRNQDWRQHYWEQGHVTRDAVIAGALAGSGPMVWCGMQAGPLSAGAVRVFDEAREFGFADGIVTPVHRADGSLMTSYFSSADVLELTRQDEGALRLLALYLAAKGEQLEAAKLPVPRRLAGTGPGETPPAALPRARVRPELTRRQLDCLEWLRDGKTYWEIGQILTVSERTVKFHVQEACRALGVRTREQALVEAALAGLLRQDRNR